MELRYLVALEAVASERSFRRAAERLGYTQSAVSQQIAALERDLGERLVVRPRGRGETALTDDGAVLLRHARAIGERVDAARRPRGAPRRPARRAARGDVPEC